MQAPGTAARRRRARSAQPPRSRRCPTRTRAGGPRGRPRRASPARSPAGRGASSPAGGRGETTSLPRLAQRIQAASVLCCSSAVFSGLAAKAARKSPRTGDAGGEARDRGEESERRDRKNKRANERSAVRRRAGRGRARATSVARSFSAPFTRTAASHSAIALMSSSWPLPRGGAHRTKHVRGTGRLVRRMCERGFKVTESKAGCKKYHWRSAQAQTACAVRWKASERTGRGGAQRGRFDLSWGRQ